MFWRRPPKDRAQRAQALALATELVATWAPEEQGVLELFGERYLDDQDLDPQLAGAQNFGMEFDLPLALVFLYLAAEMVGAEVRGRRARDTAESPVARALVAFRGGKPVPVVRETICHPAWTARLVAPLANHVESQEDRLRICHQVGLPAPEYPPPNLTPLDFWRAVVESQVQRRDCHRLGEIYRVAAELFPEIDAFADIHRDVLHIC